MKEQIWTQIEAVRQQSPLVHSITNYVVMNNTANALLAVGASPIMAHAHPEMADMVSIAGALVINIGTLDEYWVKSMMLAIEQANVSGKPWVLDPVGAGATLYRDEVLQQILVQKPSIIRGNASEILALANKNTTQTKGVDSTNASTDAVLAAKQLNEEFGSVVCISGAIDIIVGQGKIIKLSNGHPLMAKVTGMGCTATALTGAFVAVNPQGQFWASVSAMALMGVAGQIAANLAKGPASLQLHFLDTLYQLTQQDFLQYIQVDEYE
ncbi:hydroxyethylthiazole kinase [Flectobacillus major]|uniref:hydroxyethylthiazole kinase n=1 Tax=Flectobacillus major TaxID=103 RepID=UPI00041A09D1|nr:hydroxyethylthiazole kinase [Flectobacillus major]